MTMVQEKFPGFTAEEKRLSSAPTPVAPAKKVSTENHQQNEHAKTRNEETPMVTEILNTYLRAGISVELISQQFGYSVDDIVSVLEDYRNGKYRKRYFSPSLHDRIIDYVYEKGFRTARDAEVHFHLRNATCGGIINGTYYCGKKYDRAQVTAMWDARKAGASSESVNDTMLNMKADLDQCKKELEELRCENENLKRWKTGAIQKMNSVINFLVKARGVVTNE